MVYLPTGRSDLILILDCMGGSRGRVQGVRTKKKTMWFIGVEVEQETSAPPPEKNPGSAPGLHDLKLLVVELFHFVF